MKIMFSAGETSGDLYGESLDRAVLEKCPEAELIGFGGPKNGGGRCSLYALICVNTALWESGRL